MDLDHQDKIFELFFTLFLSPRESLQGFCSLVKSKWGPLQKNQIDPVLWSLDTYKIKSNIYNTECQTSFKLSPLSIISILLVSWFGCAYLSLKSHLRPQRLAYLKKFIASSFLFIFYFIQSPTYKFYSPSVCSSSVCLLVFHGLLFLTWFSLLTTLLIEGLRGHINFPICIRHIN